MPVATKQRPLVATSAILQRRSFAGRLQQPVDERQAVAQRRVHRGGRGRRLIEDARVVQERQEQMKDVLAGRQAADVAPQEIPACSPASRSRRPRTHVARRRRSEPNSHDRKRNGSASSAERVCRRVLASPTRPTSASARVSLRQAVEVDLVRLGARTLLQQHVAALNEAEAEPFRRCGAPRRATRVQGAARRKQRARQVLWLVSEVCDEVAHGDFSSIRIERSAPRGGSIRMSSP